MFEWLNKTIAAWPTFFVNAAVDYVNMAYLRPMMPAGGYMGLVPDGIAFAAKQAAGNTSYFQSGGLGGLPLVGSMYSSLPGQTPVGTRR